MLYGALKRLVSYRFVHIILLLFTESITWQKLTQKFVILTHAYRLTAACYLFLFVVPWGDVRKATQLCLDCTKSMHTDWNIEVLLFIHVNFDHAWTEHYPVTLIKQQCYFFRSPLPPSPQPLLLTDMITHDTMHTYRYGS